MRTRISDLLMPSRQMVRFQRGVQVFGGSEGLAHSVQAIMARTSVQEVHVLRNAQEYSQCSQGGTDYHRERRAHSMGCLVGGTYPSRVYSAYMQIAGVVMWGFWIPLTPSGDNRLCHRPLHSCSAILAGIATMTSLDVLQCQTGRRLAPTPPRTGLPR